MLRVDLVFVGFGNVARRFVRLLEVRRADLARRGIEWRVVAAATRRHGTAANSEGLDAVRLAEAVEAGWSLHGFDADRVGSASGVQLIERLAERRTEARELVVLETTVLDIAAGQPATDHVRAALRSGAHVITANKGPVAFAFSELESLARTAGRQFLYEGAVMDGIPIFNLVRETLPSVQIQGLRGVLNSTTNFVLTAMERGREFGESLAEMQAAGIAEADASLDVDGWDAAAKTAALANVLLDARITPQEVERTGIGHLTGEGVRAAAAAGRRVKLVSRAVRRDGRVTARVAPEELPQDDLLATLRDQQNALVFETDLLGDLSMVQLGGGLTQTAYALLSDLVTLARTVRRSEGVRP
jgi:homoserine dehydrogenase